MSTVDVVVPCYNYGRYLRQCVESVLRQTGVTVRVLIIDDASPDDSAAVGTELARMDSRVLLVRHEINRGHITTYNEGIEWVSAEYMLLLSADDYLLPGALERATSLMCQHAEISFVFGRALELHSDGRVTPILTGVTQYDSAKRYVSPSMDFIEVSSFANRVSTPTAVVRTSALRQVGGYRPELPHSGDMEMWLRLASVGPVGIVGEYQAVYRRHDSNMSLTYCTTTELPDLLQRKAALDWFLCSSSARLPNVRALRDRAYRKLSLEVICAAHKAFELEMEEESQQLAEFAVQMSPGVKRSGRWIKLIVKRTLGQKCVRMLKGMAITR